MDKEAIRKALDATTIGPWASVKFHDGKTFEVWQSIDNTGIARMVIHGESEANAHLIANTPTWLRELLDENDSMQQACDDAEMRAADAIAERNDCQKEIESLREDRDSWRRTAETLEREKVEARKANAALLNDIKNSVQRFLNCEDYRAADAFEKLLIQYDTAQPTAPQYTCGECYTVFDRPADGRCPTCRIREIVPIPTAQMDDENDRMIQEAME